MVVLGDEDVVCMVCNYFKKFELFYGVLFIEGYEFFMLLMLGEEFFEGEGGGISFVS